MSRTEKDRPYWVRVADASRVIDHDHTDGRCIVSDDRRERWAAFRHHYHERCAKYERVEYTCPKDNPERPYPWRIWREPDVRPICWDRSYRVDEHGNWTWHVNQCLGHVRWVRHDEIPCSCDDRVRPTCFPAEPDEWRWSAYGGGGVPRDFVRAVWTGPQRRLERDGLRARARAYNAGERADLDYESEQHRHRARWYYH